MPLCSRRHRRPALRYLIAMLTAACAGSPGSPASPPPPPPCPAGAECVTATVGSSLPLTLEVADTPEERAQGLTGRQSVPDRTGMIFVYDRPAQDRYFMYGVPVPLTAVFVSAGRVVHVVEMPPCTAPSPAECPTYGPDEPFDRVVETAPETLAGKVQVGDALVVTS